MKIIRKTNIFVKTKRIFTVNRCVLDGELILCPDCGELMIDAQSAARLLSTNIRDVFRLIENGQGHFFESEDKVAYLCRKFFAIDKAK